MSALPPTTTAKADFRTRSCLLYPRKRTLGKSLSAIHPNLLPVRRLEALSTIYSRAVFSIPLSRSEALGGIAQPVLRSPARTAFNHRRINMMKFPSTLDEENLLTYEVSDEALETAGGKEIAANFTLGSCTGLSECPG